jgi:ABC-type lipoprotein release transport system permease subunit
LVFCCGNKHIGPHKSELLGKRFDAALAHSPQVTGYSFGTLGGVKVGGIGVTGLAMDPRKGSVEPSLVEGHLPEGTDQILLGTKTMDTLGVSMGDTVPVTGQTGTYRMRVVGGVASPPFFFSFTGPGQGAAFSVAAEERILGGHLPPDDGAYFIRFAPGTNGQAFLGNLRHRIPGSFVVPQPPSGQVNNLRGISNVPLVLAGIVALMAAATLAHTLITSIRRRRLDFAILKTLGFERRQVSAAVAWQATALSLVALAVGLPLGVMSGRLTWHVFSSRLGVVPDAVVPLFAVLMAIPAAIIVANLLAVIPGRIASRLKAASVMRSE